MASDRWHKALEFMRLRKRSYQLQFHTADGRLFLDDLARFCRANEPCFDADARRHALLEGRREVWLRIQNHLGLSPDQLLMLYGGPEINAER